MPTRSGEMTPADVRAAAVSLKALRRGRQLRLTPWSAGSDKVRPGSAYGFRSSALTPKDAVTSPLSGSAEGWFWDTSSGPRTGRVAAFQGYCPDGYRTGRLGRPRVRAEPRIQPIPYPGLSWGGMFGPIYPDSSAFSDGSHSPDFAELTSRCYYQ